jgi:hypothetical protein
MINNKSSQSSKKSINKKKIKSAKAHIVSLHGSPKVLKKKRKLITRAKISSTMRKKCESRKWGSKKIWPQCNKAKVNKSIKLQKNIKPNKNNKCPSGYKLVKTHTIPKCIKKSLNNRRTKSAKAHVASVYGSQKVKKRNKSLQTRTKISKTRKNSGLNIKKWGNPNIWKTK